MQPLVSLVFYNLPSLYPPSFRFVRIMTEHGLLLHNPSQDGATPVFIASQKGHSSIVDLLLGHEADPNIAMNVS